MTQKLLSDILEAFSKCSCFPCRFLIALFRFCTIPAVMETQPVSLHQSQITSAELHCRCGSQANNQLKEKKTFVTTETGTCESANGPCEPFTCSCKHLSNPPPCTRCTAVGSFCSGDGSDNSRQGRRGQEEPKVGGDGGGRSCCSL